LFGLFHYLIDCRESTKRNVYVKGLSAKKQLAKKNTLSSERRKNRTLYLKRGDSTRGKGATSTVGWRIIHIKIRTENTESGSN